MKIKTFLLLSLVVVITAFAYKDLIAWVNENSNWKFLLPFPIIIIGSVIYCKLTSQQNPEGD